ncbi:branched-chain amino acid transport system II carrier protein, partial [Paraeggerthella hominis]|uniref:branched-chain amino acid transport system II carrier protein n=1 Tax=Paraeggerthella hominis TaxID=2897351 RepID=UPI003D13E9BB
MEEQQQNARGGLRPSQLLMVGGMLFSMFFGAGNLILPPLLGLQAGTEAVPAMVGFLLAGIGLPVLGIVAVALCGGVRELAGRVSPLFASVFIALVYLTIGPFLAIPRTSSTAYEMLRPLLPGSDVIDPNVAAVVFSVAFFAVAFVLALRPGLLSRVLGKFSAPAQ